MPARIVLLGATGYTGRLIAAALLDRGRPAVLAGRSRERLVAMAGELGGGFDVATFDLERPHTLQDLLEPGDVVVAAAGPFVRWGDVAVEAAIARRCRYIDIAAEPPFLRRLFQRHGPAAARDGVPLVPAIGWESVPGNLAGALALREAGEDAVRADVGYFYDSAGGWSGGSRASQAAAATRPGFAFRAGTIPTVRGAERHRTFDVAGRRRHAVAVGTAEHFTLPQSFPGLREVNAYIGDFGALSRPVQALSLVGAPALRVRVARSLADALSRRLERASARGPTAEDRARSTTHAVAIAYDRSGAPRSEVHLRGGDGYSFTGAIAAWAATRAAYGALSGTGALGPVGAFGIDELKAGCAAAGLVG